MKNVLLLSVVVLGGCGGNWSNRDLDFVSALPSRAQLKSKLPVDASQGLAGLATRRDGLDVGEPSAAYADTKAAVTTFNGILDFLLGLLDTVRALPPTSRSAASRTWGPWADKQHPGTDFLVTVAQVDEKNFSWAIRARQRGGEFFDVVVGNFSASATARQGVGAISVPVKAFRDRLSVDPKLAALDAIEVGYFTQSYPHRVEMAFTGAPGEALSSIGYSFLEQEDLSGRAVFAVRTTDANLTAYTRVSAWLPSGAGRSDARVDEGLWAGATATECWDTSFRVSYHRDPLSTLGSAADCVAVPGR